MVLQNLVKLTALLEICLGCKGSVILHSTRNPAKARESLRIKIRLVEPKQ